MTGAQALYQRARRAGIITAHVDAWQRLRSISPEMLRLLLDALRRAGCLPGVTPVRPEEIPMSLALNAAIHWFVSQSSRALLRLQPEDWLQMATLVNVPGTTDAYPN